MPEGVLLSIVEEHELEPGDHIYCWRTAFVYAHHGIYMGNDEVIHFQPPPPESPPRGIRRFFSTFSSASSSCRGFCSRCRQLSSPNKGGIVVSTCLSCFCEGDEIRRFSYSVSVEFLLAQLRDNTCTLAPSDPPELVLHRARFLLKHGFGRYGISNRNCIDFAVYCKTGILIKVYSPVSALTAVRQFSSFFASAPLFLIVRSTDRYQNDISIRKDVEKISVESLVQRY